VPILFRGRPLGTPLRLDVLVEERVIIEVKAVESIVDIFMVKTLSYLRLSDRKLGLVINFHEARLKDGIRRVVNGLDEE
jgi:GxxExxY protein